MSEEKSTTVDQKPQRWEKMSKSRGNVILIDEVVYGVFAVQLDYEFRDRNGVVVDCIALGVWRDKSRDGMFYTSTRFGRQPIFLHEVDNPLPCILDLGESMSRQHIEDTEFWSRMSPHLCMEEVPDENV